MRSSLTRCFTVIPQRPCGKSFDFATPPCYKNRTTEYRIHPGKGNPVRIGSGPAAVIPALQEAGSFICRQKPLAVRLGRLSDEGEPEDLPGCFSHSLRR